MELRPHQIEKGQILSKILDKYKIAYLNGEVRSGKTLTALYACDLFGSKKVLIVTKKKAISSILLDHSNFRFNFELIAINYESLHKIKDKDFDLIIYDESHSLGAFPKPSKRTKLLKKMFFNLPCILMTGTPAVESGSQLYHQFFISKFSPFKEYKNFYRWADKFVDKKQMKLPTHTITDYSKAKMDLINPIIKPYIVEMTQQDAGFESKVNEQFINIETPTLLAAMANKLIEDKAIEGKTGFIFGDQPAKLMSKVHQIFNGHCIIEKANGETFTKIFSHYKAEFIKKRFANKKIAIMYYFQAELDILKQVFGSENLTTDLEEFNTTNKNFALQQSSTEGMNVSKADCLVYYNLGYSGKNYLQSRDRLTVKGREQNNVYFVCEKNGITKKIINVVRDKKDFNSKIFRREFKTTN